MTFFYICLGVIVWMFGCFVYSLLNEHRIGTIDPDGTDYTDGFDIVIESFAWPLILFVLVVGSPFWVMLKYGSKALDKYHSYKTSKKS